MRPQNKSRSRNKPGNNGGQHNGQRRNTMGNIINRVFESTGPDGKVRGTPQQIIDKYQALARDAQVSGDRVAAESYLQYAEHYSRLLGEAQRQQMENRQEREDRFGQEREDRDDSGYEQQRRPQPPQQQPMVASGLAMIDPEDFGRLLRPDRDAREPPHRRDEPGGGDRRQERAERFQGRGDRGERPRQPAPQPATFPVRARPGPTAGARARGAFRGTRQPERQPAPRPKAPAAVAEPAPAVNAAPEPAPTADGAGPAPAPKPRRRRTRVEAPRPGSGRRGRVTSSPPCLGRAVSFRDRPAVGDCQPASQAASATGKAWTTALPAAGRPMKIALTTSSPIRSRPLREPDVEGNTLGETHRGEYREISEVTGLRVEGARRAEALHGGHPGPRMVRRLGEEGAEGGADAGNSCRHPHSLGAGLLDQAGEAAEGFERDLFGAFGGRYAGLGKQRLGGRAEGAEARAKHLPALPDARATTSESTCASAGKRGVGSASIWTTALVTFGGGVKARGGISKTMRACARHSRGSTGARGLRSRRRDDALGDLLLEHERQALPKGRPGARGQPADGGARCRRCREFATTRTGGVR